MGQRFHLRLAPRLDPDGDGSTFAVQDWSPTSNWYFVMSPKPPAGNCGNPSNFTDNPPSSYHTAGINVGMADGSVRLVAQGISFTTWLRALTPMGGEVLGPDW